MSVKDDAIDRIQANFKELQLAVHDLNDERMTEAWFGDDWATKDLLAHLASWDEFATEDMQRFSRGHIPCLAALKPTEVDQWNDLVMKPRRMWPLVQVRFESQHFHDTLVDSLNVLPESMFAAGHMVAGYCGITVTHYAEHTRHIREHHHMAPFGKGDGT